MRRIVLMSVLACLLAGSVSIARAETQSAGGVQAVNSPSGYQFQVPSDWQQLPMSMQQRMGAQMFADDGAVASADGTQHGHVQTASGFGVTADALHDTIVTFLMGPPAGQGGPTFTMLANPSPVQVSNADAAEAGASSYTDSSGNPRVLAARLALRGQTTYLLVLDVSQDFYKTNPAVGQIEASFQLSGTTAAAP